MDTSLQEPECAVNETTAAHGAAAFGRVLRADGVLPLAAASILARLPIGMAAIGLVLYLQQETNSFADAGATAAAFAVGLGLTAPVLGRLVDSRGRGIFFPAGVVSALSMAAVVGLGSAGAPTALLIAAAALAGAAEPPLGGVIRHRLPQLVEPADVPTVFAVDSILIELFFILGPLLAGGLAATAGPGEALLAAALLGLVGSFWFTLQLPAHRPDPELVAARPRGGALSSPAIRLLIFAGLPFGATFGALDIALPAFGVVHGSAALGGAFAASISFGSVLGGVAYGARPRALGPPRVAFLRLAALQGALVLPLLLVPSVGAMFFFAALAGICIAPLISTRSELVRETLPPGTGNEAFSWVSVSIGFGASIGSAVAGPLVEVGGWRAGVGLACAVPAAGFFLTFARRRLLRQGY
jgi:MFS family permease